MQNRTDTSDALKFSKINELSNLNKNKNAGLFKEFEKYSNYCSSDTDEDVQKQPGNLSSNENNCNFTSVWVEESCNNNKNIFGNPEANFGTTSNCKQSNTRGGMSVHDLIDLNAEIAESSQDSNKGLDEDLNIFLGKTKVSKDENTTKNTSSIKKVSFWRVFCWIIFKFFRKLCIQQENEGRYILNLEAAMTMTKLKMAQNIRM